MHDVPAECVRDGRIAQDVSDIEVMQQDKQDRHSTQRIDPQIARARAHGLCSAAAFDADSTCRNASRDWIAASADPAAS
ncbi:hypothetical protein [Paraburkholderia susongensis]|uniref:hypothetical protein n=1 Tax=Paraburkholderia susongensis TaxID=1515439 RepID=UPI001FC9C006|nr:hypothetical protein [Paraburkholderia susongensis]